MTTNMATHWNNKEYCKRYYQKNKTAHRNRMLKLNFGITLEEYNEIFNQQDGVCAICETAETGTRNGAPITLAVDHCHDTGEIRGLLCRQCNSALGWFKDDRELLYKALMYLAPALNDDKYDIGSLESRFG